MSTKQLIGVQFLRYRSRIIGLAGIDVIRRRENLKPVVFLKEGGFRPWRNQEFRKIDLCNLFTLKLCANAATPSYILIERSKVSAKGRKMDTAVPWSIAIHLPNDDEDETGRSAVVIMPAGRASFVQASYTLGTLSYAPPRFRLNELHPHARAVSFTGDSFWFTIAFQVPVLSKNSQSGCCNWIMTVSLLNDFVQSNKQRLLVSTQLFGILSKPAAEAENQTKIIYGYRTFASR
ncbi:hypothetical protein C8Q75DRAFT_735346 [Abortiporus biennis]|nr:hypothetical protein C8Q75DRAFT_735346 [Abortiporus biennis]